MKTVVCDIEGNGLRPTQIWCVVVKEIDDGQGNNTGTIRRFHGSTLRDFVDYSLSVGVWVGHNFLTYDRKWLNRLLGTNIKVSQVVDTWILSQLFNVGRAIPPGCKGAHGLEAWGHRFNYFKKEHEDWSQFSPAMLERCEVDVELNAKVYEYLMREGKAWSKESIKLEHEIQYVLDIQQENGFAFDQPKAHALLAQCEEECRKLEAEIRQYCPPKPRFIKPVIVRYKKDNSMSIVGLKKIGEDALNIVGGDFSFIEWQPFTISSPSQVVERLNEAGWKPVVFNKLTDAMKAKGLKRGTPKVCEENLDTLPDTAPEAIHKIKRFLIVNSRVSNINTWFDALGEDGRIHGQVIGCGASTHRASHRSPNTANIPATKDKMGRTAIYGKECREVWTVADKVQRRLVGIDADAIQLRVLAHYMDDPDYTKAIVSGNKDLGTDVHSINQRAASLPSRETAKTFIYALLLGAGDGKLGSILGGSTIDGRIAKEKLLTAVPALARVLRMCKDTYAKGYMTRLDGGRLQVPSEHKTLACYLQAGEAVIMKKAYVLSYLRVKWEGLKCLNVGWIHDEIQWDSSVDCADKIGQITAEAITKAGEFYKLKCPLVGQYKVGLSWAETH